MAVGEAEEDAVGDGVNGDAGDAACISAGVEGGEGEGGAYGLGSGRGGPRQADGLRWGGGGGGVGPGEGVRSFRSAFFLCPGVTVMSSSPFLLHCVCCLARVSSQGPVSSTSEEEEK